MGAFLTDQQIADYHRDGFLVLPDFAKPSACIALKAQAEKILHNFDPDAIEVSLRRMNSLVTLINNSLTQRPESFVSLKRKPLTTPAP